MSSPPASSSAPNSGSRATAGPESRAAATPVWPPDFQGCLDEPLSGGRHPRQRIPVRGWVHAGERQAQIAAVHAVGDGAVLGSTRTLQLRPDVAAALGLAAGVATGFHLLALAPATRLGQPLPLTVEVEFADGGRIELARREVGIAASDYTTADYGDLCNPTHTWPMARHYLYTSGFPSPVADGECVRQIAARVRPGDNVFDVGCGIGAYAPHVRALGSTWTGAETSASHLAQLARAGLPARKIRRWPRYRLPAADGEFDVTLAIEVLEHVAKPERFLREIARVTRRRAIFSVPEASIIPFLHTKLCVPWHMLEADHRWFFSRFSLQGLLAPYFRHVEVIDYGEFPVRGAEELPLPYHLLAIADH